MAASVAAPKLDGFIFTEKLGSGTYATVYKAYRKGNQREVVAVKCVLKSSLNKAATENLLTEIGILKKIKHDYIVKLKDFRWDNDYIYLIMEYCSGGDLSHFIRCKRALPEKVVKRFLQQLACALLFLHKRNISHMDLKPQNLLLSNSSSPDLKLADFGFALHFKEDVYCHSLRGSLLYMAPEIICQQKYDASVDLWSVGVILYECLFGQAPLASKSYAELEEKIRDTKPITLPRSIEVSENCRDLLLRLLQRDPKQRISFDDFFNHPFIDLEHMPSEEGYLQGVKLVSLAIKEDQENNVKNAIKHYCLALEYLVPALQFVQDKATKEGLRVKVYEYMKRAEELKQTFKPKRPERQKRPQDDGPIKYDGKRHQLSKKKDKEGEVDGVAEKTKNDSNNMNKGDTGGKRISRTMSQPAHMMEETCEPNASAMNETCKPDSAATSTRPKTALQNTVRSRQLVFTEQAQLDFLEELSTDNGTILQAIQKIRIAEMREEEEQYEGALHMYQEALETLLPILQVEKKGVRRDIYTKKFKDTWHRLKLSKCIFRLTRWKSNKYPLKTA
ncbi:serine/threonine-protein kinase ULK3-like [Ptychodera flava]|uniref:serine/threonine-protein kinase ULK3-like n=1 Tax=Ptychodera flava TaxID=63121 RepID=UPI00396A86AC